MNLKEFAVLVVLAALWGGSFLFIRIAAPALGPAMLMAARVVIAGVVLSLAAALLRKPLSLRRHGRQLLVLGLINAALPFTLIAAAELHLTASLASILNATVPLFGAIVSAIWLKERLTAKHTLGLLLGIAGVGVLVGWSPLAMTLPAVLSVAAMLVAALLYAIGGVYTKKHLASASNLTLAVGQQWTAALWLALPALWLRPTAVPPIPALWALLGLALLSTALAYVLFFYLIARVGPTKTLSVTFLIPVFGVLWGAVFLQEVITSGMFVGLAFIFASLVLVNDMHWRKERVPHSQPS